MHNDYDFKRNLKIDERQSLTLAKPNTKIGIAWRERDCRQVMLMLPECSYEGCRDTLREVASSHDDGVSEELRRKALGMLRHPDDDDILERELPTLGDYARYDLSNGWPHEHAFEQELLSAENATGNPGDYECIDETYQLRCPCGLTEREVRRIHRFRHVEESHCPICGGTETTYDYYAGEVCAGFGHSADDFTVATATDEVTTEILSTEIVGWD